MLKFFTKFDMFYSITNWLTLKYLKYNFSCLSYIEIGIGLNVYNLILLILINNFINFQWNITADKKLISWFLRYVLIHIFLKIYKKK